MYCNGASIIKVQLGIHILALQLPVDNQHLHDDNLQTCFSKLAGNSALKTGSRYGLLRMSVMPRCNYSDCSMYKFLDELGTSMQPSHQCCAVDFLSFCNVYPVDFEHGADIWFC